MLGKRSWGRDKEPPNKGLHVDFVITGDVNLYYYYIPHRRPKAPCDGQQRKSIRSVSGVR